MDKTQDGVVSLSSLSIIPSPQCTRIEAELGLYKNAVPMTEACELCVLLLYPPLTSSSEFCSPLLPPPEIFNRVVAHIDKEMEPFCPTKAGAEPNAWLAGGGGGGCTIS